MNANSFARPLGGGTQRHPVSALPSSGLSLPVRQLLLLSRDHRRRCALPAWGSTARIVVPAEAGLRRRRAPRKTPAKQARLGGARVARHVILSPDRGVGGREYRLDRGLGPWQPAPAPNIGRGDPRLAALSQAGAPGQAAGHKLLDLCSSWALRAAARPEPTSRPAFVGGSAAQRDARPCVGWWAVEAAEMVHVEYCGSVLVEGGGTPRSLRFLRVRGLGLLS